MLRLNNGVKNAFIIQAINAFIYGVIFIIVPLLMVDRGVTVEYMGLIFAVLPIITQTSRLFFGTVSDYVGRKKFYFLNGILNLVFLGSYYFATTAVGFLIGKIGEGVRSASLWAVNRAYLIDHIDEQEEALIKLKGINSVFQALGMLLSGFLLTFLFYDKTLILLMALSVFLFPNIRMLNDIKTRILNLKVALLSLDFRHKSEKFKNFIGIFFLIGLSWGLITGYILPLYLKLSGVATENIGLLLGVRILLNGISVYVFSLMWEGKKKILVGGILYSLILVLFPYSNYSTLPILIVLWGTISGIADAGIETIFVNISNEKTVAKDIGTLMIGTHAGITITQALSGFVITRLGFHTLFFLSAMLYVLFSFTAYYNMNGE